MVLRLRLTFSQLIQAPIPRINFLEEEFSVFVFQTSAFSNFHFLNSQDFQLSVIFEFSIFQFFALHLMPQMSLKNFYFFSFRPFLGGGRRLGLGGRVALVVSSSTGWLVTKSCCHDSVMAMGGKELSD